MPPLSRRLQAIADLIPPGVAVADIGTDHAFLPVSLALQGTQTAIIATEITAGPFTRALESVLVAGVGDRVELRLGDGLTVLEPGEVQVVVIAGMGSSTITTILAAGSAVLAGVTRLILQPMGGGEGVRRWLAAHGFAIAAEDLIKEDGHFYEIIAAAPGTEKIESEVMYTAGPRLFETRHPLLPEYLAGLLEHWEQILRQMDEAKSDLTGERRREIQTKAAQLKEVIRCLQPSGM